MNLKLTQKVAYVQTRHNIDTILLSKTYMNKDVPLRLGHPLSWVQHDFAAPGHVPQNFHGQAPIRCLLSCAPDSKH